MDVLVTGGAGFIGSHLVGALVERGDRVRVLDWRDDPSSVPGARFAQGDVRDPEAVARALGDAEVVVHLAAEAGVRRSLSDPRRYADVNVGGTATVLDVVRGRGGGRVVFAGSSSVYGVQPLGPCSERTPADAPQSPYAATKRAGELLGHAAWAGWGLPFTSLRLFTVYGPRQRPSMAIARFARHALAGEPLPVFGDGSMARDYTWVGDVVAAFVAAAERPLGYRVLNVGAGEPATLSELVAGLERVIGRPLAVDHLPVPPGDVPRTHADTRQARRLLDWAPTVSLDEGLRRVVAAARR